MSRDMLRQSFISFVIILVSLALSSCGLTPKQKSELIVWPMPPELPRFAHDAALYTELDIVKVSKSEMFRRAVVGEDPKAKAAYIKPFDVAAGNGRIFISDTMANVVHLFDIPRRALMRIGKSEQGKLGNPLGIAIDKEINLYVADSGSKQVVVYNATGHFIKRIGSSDDLVRPSDVAVSPDGSRIYVVDSGGLGSEQHQVVIYDNEGKKLNVIGKRGTREGEFNLPNSAAVGPDGNLYVLDAGNFRVQVFDGEGKFLRAWGQVGRGLGNFARPRGLAIDPDGNIYVTDASYRNFQLFTPEGRLLMYIGGAGLEDKPGQYVLPAGIAVDETYRVYVVDQIFKKVDIIRRLGEQEAKAVQANQAKQMAKRREKVTGRLEAKPDQAESAAASTKPVAPPVDPLVEQLRQLNNPTPAAEEAPASSSESNKTLVEENTEKKETVETEQAVVKPVSEVSSPDISDVTPAESLVEPQQQSNAPAPSAEEAPAPDSESDKVLVEQNTEKKDAEEAEQAGVEPSNASPPTEISDVGPESVGSGNSDVVPEAGHGPGPDR